MAGVLGRGGTSGSGNGASIQDDFYFSDTTERDAFTTANPDRLFDGVICAVGSVGTYSYFEWNATLSQWFATVRLAQGPTGAQGPQGSPGTDGDYVNSAGFVGDDIVFGDTGGRNFPLTDAVNTLQGPKGDNAPQVLSQYGQDIGGPWVDQATYDGNPSLYNFRQDSVDGGATFGAAYQFKSSQAELPAGWRWVDDGNNGLQLQDPNGNTIWEVSENGVTSSKFKILDSILEFGSTKNMHDLGENVGFVNTQSGQVFTPTWQDGEGDWRPFCRNKGSELTRWNGEPFINADTGNTVTFELPLTITMNRRSHAFYVNSVSTFNNCTLLILQGGKTKMRLEGYDILPGEQRYAFADSVDGHPFIDFLQGQSYTVQLLNESGSLVTVYAQDGNSALPWFALDTTEFTDTTLVCGDSMGGGVTWDDTNRKINLTAATSDDLGGVKVGSGLAIQPDGKLYSTVSGSIVTSVPDLAGRNALPQIAQSYTCNVISENRIYYLNANQDPSVDANWQLGPTTEASVTGFKGKGDTDPRVGVIEATVGDYTSDLIPVVDDDNGEKWVRGKDATGFYWKRIA